MNILKMEKQKALEDIHNKDNTLIIDDLKEDKIEVPIKRKPRESADT